MLVFSPEILVFLFFMITDPKTIPADDVGPPAYAVGIGLLATLLIAPQTTEFGTKVAVLGGAGDRLRGSARRGGWLASRAGVPWRSRRPAPRSRAGARRGGGLRRPGRPRRHSRPHGRRRPPARPRLGAGELPEVTIVPAKDVSTADRQRDRAPDRRRPRRRPPRRGRGAGRDATRPAPTEAAAGARLAAVWQQHRRRRIDGRRPDYNVEHVRAHARARRRAGAAARRRHGGGDGGARYLHRLAARPLRAKRPGPVRADARARAPERPLRHRRLARRRRARLAVPAGSRVAGGAELGGVRLVDVARHVGLDFRHGAFRFETSPGSGGDDGRRRLLARLRRRRLARPLRGQLVLDRGRRGPLEGARRPAPQRALPERQGHVRGREPGLRRRSHLRGNGCVAADFDGDGRTDLYVTATGYDALLWNARRRQVRRGRPRRRDRHVRLAHGGHRR